ncbi:MAG: hypothetical protein QOJ51_3946 [Acidobacteriaceae bacterium]|jgi:hypothetical protein|nr:hypothetical protein [Acidobacteriaceae bacterium]MEA2261121.1 hypothetical protein [Acidobacteriaceae bacterium]
MTMLARGSFAVNIIPQPPEDRSEGLARIAGTMTIIIAEGKHSYELAYTLPEETRT